MASVVGPRGQIQPREPVQKRQGTPGSTPDAAQASKRPRSNIPRQWQAGYAQVASGDKKLQVVIGREGQDDVSFSGNHLLEFLDDVGEVINGTPSGSGSITPQFSYTCLWKGKLLISAANEASRDWLLRSLNEIRPWKDARLVARDPTAKEGPSSIRESLNGSPTLGVWAEETVYYCPSSNNPKACILVKDAKGVFLLPGLCTRDLAVIKLLIGKGNTKREIAVCSAYFPIEMESPPRELSRLVLYCEEAGLPLLVGCDSNSPPQCVGDKDVWPRGRALLEFLTLSGMQIVNRGSVPIFFTTERQSVIDLTLCSAELHILFDLDELFQINETDYRNPKATRWDLYVEEIEGRLVGIPSRYVNETDVEMVLNRLNNAIIESRGVTNLNGIVRWSTIMLHPHPSKGRTVAKETSPNKSSRYILDGGIGGGNFLGLGAALTINPALRAVSENDKKNVMLAVTETPNYSLRSVGTWRNVQFIKLFETRGGTLIKFTFYKNYCEKITTEDLNSVR
ncbi:hypothetical protein NQ317_015344 [Molorchus minor]|uniref:Endonuclease/exonuclease/phosphatase domain-containing protein n=1 Tax=Molorchus minor TaxID=1323400 RepID=A0ABQ9ISS6_9CUCU|nr:hypothetical protein NQ317_015344 [Molorchus minor]